jgi:hypothetical protein
MFRKRVLVHCQKHTKHTIILVGKFQTFRVKAADINICQIFGSDRQQMCKISILTSQETHYVFAKESNRLMLCGETVAVCCENRTEHTDTVRTSQETQIHGEGGIQRCTMLITVVYSVTRVI